MYVSVHTDTHVVTDYKLAWFIWRGAKGVGGGVVYSEGGKYFIRAIKQLNRGTEENLYGATSF